MQNLLILYNPYYQEDVIEQHLKVLIDKKRVAFGKVKSKLKNIEHNFQDKLYEIYKSVDNNNYLQLFLTDYSSIYVAKVTKVSNEDLYHLAPTYYKEKNLEVEAWYIIDDICEIVKDDFQETRDEVLVNLTTINFGNHTYAVYGNSYVYPLVVDMKNKVDYFAYGDEDFKYYFDIFKSPKYLSIKQNIIDFSFGLKYIFSMHPNSLDNIISSEIELQEHKLDKTYDFSSIVIKYSKTMEQEIYLFIKDLFKILIEKSNDIAHIEYTVNGMKYKMPEILEHKPNLGTYKFLLKAGFVESAIKENFEDIVYLFIRKKFINYINFLQDIRNEVVHGNSATLKEVNILRDKILGIASESILIDILKYKQKLVVVEK